MTVVAQLNPMCSHGRAQIAFCDFRDLLSDAALNFLFLLVASKSC